MLNVNSLWNPCYPPYNYPSYNPQPQSSLSPQFFLGPLLGAAGGALGGWIGGLFGDEGQSIGQTIGGLLGTGVGTILPVSTAG